MSEIIYFNGKRYSSVSEMSGSTRQLYEKIDRFIVDDNRDGVPDFVQSGGLAGIKEVINMVKDVSKISTTPGFQTGGLSLIRVTDQGIYFNGKYYADPTEMPASTRMEYERIINSAEDGTEEIFDESWRRMDREEYFKPHDDEILNRQFNSTPLRVTPPIEEIDSTRRFLVVTFAAILIMAGLAAAWFLFF